ncbi:MAG: hypothetical protein P1U38_14400 [Aeromicrobium sp.]|nr:hypothetical protein [Aeromicrobium sp.]MDF1705954.1 hypothetical protein [Aeromicrobium sp.]
MSPLVQCRASEWFAVGGCGHLDAPFVDGNGFAGLFHPEDGKRPSQRHLAFLENGQRRGEEGVGVREQRIHERNNLSGCQVWELADVH